MNRKVTNQAQIAAETLVSYIMQQKGGPGRRAYTPRRVYGVFTGDILLHWSVGTFAKTWASQRAQNCWNNELRVQYMGMH